LGWFFSSALQLFNFANLTHRYFGVFGLYYSLEYLSLSDATVLTFLVPMCTAMAGALFLGETFSCREAFAGRKRFSSPNFRRDTPTQKCISRQFCRRCSDCTAYCHIWLGKPFFTNRKSAHYSYKSCRERKSN
jgi:hypothetical protein